MALVSKTTVYELHYQEGKGGKWHWLNCSSDKGDLIEMAQIMDRIKRPDLYLKIVTKVTTEHEEAV